MKSLPGILFLLALACGTGHRLEAQVTIVRTLPQSSTPEVTAQWTAPRPEAPAALVAGRTVLAGRISLGGSAGIDALGEATYGFLTDSRIRLVQPLGPAAGVQLDANAMRKNTLDGVQQAYAAEVGLRSERFSLSAAGTFTWNEATVEGSSRTTMDAALRAALAATFLPALPITLSYLHNGKQAEGQADAGLPLQSDSLKLSSIGTIGPIGVELAGAFDRATNADLDVETLGANGRLQLTVPALPFLSVLARVSPAYARTDYTASAASIASTSLESNLGLLFPLSDALQLALIAGRIDAWSEAEGTAAAPPPYQITWNGELGAEVRGGSGFSASPALKIAKTVGGVWRSALVLAGEWAPPPEGLLRSARAEGRLSLTSADGGAFLETEDAWSLDLAFSPLERMNLSASYGGSFDGGPAVTEGPAWSHKASARLDHEPDPSFAYRASAALTSRRTAAGGAVTQEYAAAATYKPQWNFRQYLFGLAETVTISTVALGKTSLTAAVPIVPSLNARCAFDWEWIGETAPGEGAGHQFRHLLGAAVSGQRLPLAFSAEYAFSHGYRGVRHDVTAALRFPFADSFVLEGNLAFGSYEEGGASRLPLLFSLGLAYQF